MLHMCANKSATHLSISLCLSVCAGGTECDMVQIVVKSPPPPPFNVGAGLKELLAGAVRILIETVGDYMRPAEDKESHTPPQIVTPEYLTPESDVE